jgi:hypothetical protein
MRLVWACLTASALLQKIMLMASWAEALLAEEEVHLSQNAPQSFPECR